MVYSRKYRDRYTVLGVCIGGEKNINVWAGTHDIGHGLNAPQPPKCIKSETSAEKTEVKKKQWAFIPHSFSIRHVTSIHIYRVNLRWGSINAAVTLQLCFKYFIFNIHILNLLIVYKSNIFTWPKIIYSDVKYPCDVRLKWKLQKRFAFLRKSNVIV